MIYNATIFIITVPPIDELKKPDLKPLKMPPILLARLEARRHSHL